MPYIFSVLTDCGVLTSENRSRRIHEYFIRRFTLMFLLRFVLSRGLAVMDGLAVAECIIAQVWVLSG